MKLTKTKLDGVKIIEPKVFEDNRGFFFESFQIQRYKDSGVNSFFVQDNISRSSYGVLRGLHYQLEHPQGKLVIVTRGTIFDVAIDIRYGSPTFCKWVGIILSDKNHKQLYIPPGFAHGFCVLSEYADIYYKCTNYYYSEDEYGIFWNDKEINIKWPLDVKPNLSDKDTQYKSLKDIPVESLPKFKN